MMNKIIKVFKNKYVKFIFMMLIMNIPLLILWIFIGISGFISPYFFVIFAFLLTFSFLYLKGNYLIKPRFIYLFYAFFSLLTLYIIYYIVISISQDISFFNVIYWLIYSIGAPGVIAEYTWVLGCFVIGLMVIFVYLRIYYNYFYIVHGMQGKPGPRYSESFEIHGDNEDLVNRLDQMLYTFGFVKHQYGKETLYAKFTHPLVSISFVGLTYGETRVRIEAFVILGKKEDNLRGIWGAFAKNYLKNEIDHVIAVIKSGEYEKKDLGLNWKD